MKENEYTHGSFIPNGRIIKNEEIKFFPELGEVFENLKNDYGKVLFPLCTIDLQIINPTWLGKAHFILTFIDYSGETNSLEYFTDYCDDYSISFDKINDKYTLQADIRILEVSEGYEEFRNELELAYKRSKEGYSQGIVYEMLSDRIETNELIMQVGGKPMWTQNDETPKDPNGKELEFIGQVFGGYFFPNELEQDIFLFYSPEFNFFVQRFQYS
ncbi:MAG: hypothetical protein R3B93_21755 [Bacteroidia bacterium]